MAWSTGGIEPWPGVPRAVSRTHRTAFSDSAQAMIGGFVWESP